MLTSTSSLHHSRQPQLPRTQPPAARPPPLEPSPSSSISPVPSSISPLLPLRRGARGRAGRRGAQQRAGRGRGSWRLGRRWLWGRSSASGDGGVRGIVGFPFLLRRRWPPLLPLPSVRTVTWSDSPFSSGGGSSLSS